jgi:hypothetical protein
MSHYCYFCGKLVGNNSENPVCQFRFPNIMRLVDTCREHLSIQETPTPGCITAEQLAEIVEEYNKLR